MGYLGELTALSTALLWSFTAVFFSEAGKRIGSFNVNKIRLVFAVVIYAVLLTIQHGHPWPDQLNREQFFWLALSGFVGLVFGDGCGFKALVMIGPRLMTLIAASVPIFTIVIAWLFLGEKLHTLDAIGIGLTLGGIYWVVSERRFGAHNELEKEHPDAGTLTKGVILALGAALGQAVGLVLSKKGMQGAGDVHVAPLDASFIRMIAATPIIWGYSVMAGKVRPAISSFSNLKGIIYTALGAVFGPVLGVWSSLVAVSMIKTGIAATLNSTTPVLIIPTVVMVYKEKVTFRAIIGAVITVVGVAILFLA